MSQTVLSEIIHILNDELEVEEPELGASSAFEHLGFDSLVLVELSLVLRREYGVDLTDEDIVACTTLGRLADLVSNRTAAA